MKKKRLYLVVSALLWTALAVWVCIQAVCIWQEGTALREAGDVMAPVYTPEKVAERLAPVVPVFAAAVVMAAAGIILGIHGEAGTGTKPALQMTEKKPPKAGALRAVRLAVLILAAILLAAGIQNGSMQDVLIKAINLCTECIGLG